MLFPKPLISTIDVQSAKPVLSTKGCGSARACALAIVFLSCCSTASAEVHTLTLRQALDFAAKQNADVLLARLDAQRAEQGIRVAKDPFSPKVYGGSGLAWTSGYPNTIDGNAPSIFEAKTNMSLFNRPASYQVAEARENARGAQMDAQAARNVTGNVALDLRDIRRPAGVVRTPKLAAIGRVDQIGVDAQFVAMLRDAAHQHCTYLQALADLPRVIFLAFEFEDRASSHNFQVRQL